MKEWKKFDHAFICEHEIGEVLEIKLLFQHANHDYWEVMVLNPKKKFKKKYGTDLDSFNSRYFHEKKIDAIKAYKRVLNSEIVDLKDEIDDRKCWIKEKKVILKKLLKQEQEEESKNE